MFSFKKLATVWLLASMFRYKDLKAEDDDGSNLCFPEPDISTQLCSKYSQHCDLASNYSDVVRIACGNTCGICSDETNVEKYWAKTPRNDMTLDMRIGFIASCDNVNESSLLTGVAFWANFIGNTSDVRIRTPGGNVRLVFDVKVVCPLSGAKEITCDQVQEAAVDLAYNLTVDTAIIVGSCPTTQTQVFDAAKLLHFTYNINDGGEPLSWSRYRYQFYKDPDDFAPLVRQAQGVGIGAMGLAYVRTEDGLARALSLRRQIQYEANANKSAALTNLVYDITYTPLPKNENNTALYSLSDVEYVEVYNVTVWDEILLGMQDAGVEYAIFVSDAEAVSIVNRIADLKINFKAVSFDAEAHMIEHFLGSKANYMTSTMNYHNSMNVYDQVFGTHEQFVEKYKLFSGHKPGELESFLVFFLEFNQQMVQKYGSFYIDQMLAANEFMDIDTILGPLKFSPLNVMIDWSPLTVQIQSGELGTVLPDNVASSVIVMPTPSWACQALLPQTNPEVCSDSELDVWQYCTENFKVILNNYNSTSCSTRRDFIAALSTDQDGGSSSILDIWWMLTIIFVAAALVLAGSCGLIIRLWYVGKYRSDNLWISMKEIGFAEDNKGNIVTLGQGSHGPIVGATFRGIQVVVKVMVPGFDFAGVSTTRKSSVGRTSIHEVEAACRGSHLVPGKVSSIGLDIAGSIHSTVQSLRRVPSLSGSVTGDDAKSRFSSSISKGGLFLFGIRTSRSVVVNPKKSMSSFTTEATRLLKMRHPHILTVLGAFVDKDKNRCLVMEWMVGGSLEEFLRNSTTSLDTIPAVDILCHIAGGLLHLHRQSPPIIHGDVRAHNVFVDSHLHAKIGGFGLHSGDDEGKAWESPFWRAPEVMTFDETSGLVDLGSEDDVNESTDVYAFGITIWEVFSKQDPYSEDDLDKPPSEILPSIINEGLRPRRLPRSVPKKVTELMEECWHKNPLRRPQLQEVSDRLQKISKDLKTRLEETSLAMEKNTRLLHQVLPPKVVAALRKGKKVLPEQFSQVTIFFSDIVGFTDISASLSPERVMNMLDRLYTKFDLECTEYNLFKVETIGDAYMCVGGIPDKQEDQTVRVALFAMAAIQAARSVLVSEDFPDMGFVNIRVGIHTGSVIASVVGDLNPRYCLFGDTVNTASRMESNSEKGQINLSPEANQCLRDQAPGAWTRSRGLLNIKGKGPLECFFLEQSSECDWACRDALISTLARNLSRAYSSFTQDCIGSPANSFKIAQNV